MILNPGNTKDAFAQNQPVKLALAEHSFTSKYYINIDRIKVLTLKYLQAIAYLDRAIAFKYFSNYLNRSQPLI